MANKLIQDLGAGAFALTDLLEHQPIAGPPSTKGNISALVTLLNTVYGTGPFVPLAGGTMTGLLQFSGTGHFGLRLNNLTTVERDAIGVGSAGMAIWNTTTSRFDLNIGGSWQNFVRVAGDTMTGLLTIAQATANTSNLILSGQSLTGANAQSLLSLAGTWNTTGNPAAFSMVITDSASGTSSNLMSVTGGAGGATTMMILSKTGAIVLNGSVAVGGSQDIKWTGRSVMQSPANGQVILYNAAMTDFGRLQFGGTTSAFPSIKRSATLLQVRLADDSAYAPLEANTLRTATAYTVATLPAAGTAGRLSYVTDALAPAFLAIVVGGGAIVTPVFDNGTNWLSI